MKKLDNFLFVYQVYGGEDIKGETRQSSRCVEVIYEKI